MNAPRISAHPGYDFIPLPREVDRRARPQARHDRRQPGTFSGALELTWHLEQPIHIGSGFKTLVRTDGAPIIVRQHVRLGDVPCVPGSTFKGVLRSRYEAITKSCTAPPKVPHKSESSSYPRSTIRLSERAKNAPALAGRCRVLRKDACASFLCPACALFGLEDLRSRIIVADALPDTDRLERLLLPTQFGPRLHHIGSFHHHKTQNVLEVTSLHGRKFAFARDERPLKEGHQHPAKQHVEALPAGTRLHQSLRFLNLTAAELGGLLAVLGHTPASRLKIGAGKSHGFGRIVLATLPTFRLAAGSPQLDLAACVAAFRGERGTECAHLETLVRFHGEDC